MESSPGFRLLDREICDIKASHYLNFGIPRASRILYPQHSPIVPLEISSMTHGINLGSHEYWSPDASFTQVVKGSWKGQRRELRVFILSSPQFLATLRYIHAGTHLPVTREEYSRHFGVDLSGIPEIASRVDGLVKSYGEVRFRFSALMAKWVK
jgi:hypothetical protein